MTRNKRTNNELRPVQVIRDFCPASDGSVLISMGDTRIICAASISDYVPGHAEERGWGWMTAEYSMLPYSTSPRTERKMQRPDGRAVEIQRLIGRSLRSSLDLSKMKGFSIALDCDVLQADGGTRTASITGGFIALRMAVNSLISSGLLAEDPIVANVAAVSAGYAGGELLLDLDYEEDHKADVDMNIVMDSRMNFVEVQGTGEHTSFSRQQLNALLDIAGEGIKKLFAIQDGKQ